MCGKEVCCVCACGVGGRQYVCDSGAHSSSIVRFSVCLTSKYIQTHYLSTYLLWGCRFRPHHHRHRLHCPCFAWRDRFPPTCAYTCQHACTHVSVSGCMWLYVSGCVCACVCVCLGGCVSCCVCMCVCVCVGERGVINIVITMFCSAGSISTHLRTCALV